MKKVLFICPCATKENLSKVKYEQKYHILPLGVLSIISYCNKYVEKNNTQFFILDFNQIKYNDITLKQMKIKIEQTLQDINPDIVAISILFDSLLNTINMISKSVKEYDNNICVLCGGTAISISYNEILSENLYVDAISYSEGEIPFSNFLKSNSIFDFLENDNSFITKTKLKNKNFIPETKYIYDLDEIPPLPYHMVDMNQYNNTYNEEVDKKSIVMHTARGCPFQCKFCTAPKLFGQKLRLMSAERVLNDLKNVIKEYKFNKVSIFDEQLLANKERAKKILSGIIKLNVQLEIDNGVNIALLDDDIINLIFLADIKRFVLSIESGSQKVLDNIMNKPVKLDKVKNKLKELSKGDFYITSNFVIGMPGETQEDREATKEFILSNPIDWSVVFVAMPFKGSQLYDECMLNNCFIYDKNGVMRVETKNIHYEDMEMQAYLINLECNFVKNYSMRIKNYNKAKMLMNRVRIKYPYHAFAQFYYANCCLKLNEIVEYKNAINNYFDIISKNNKWKFFAEHFNLPISNKTF